MPHRIKKPHSYGNAINNYVLRNETNIPKFVNLLGEGGGTRISHHLLPSPSKVRLYSKFVIKYDNSILTFSIIFVCNNIRIFETYRSNTIHQWRKWRTLGVGEGALHTYTKWKINNKNVNNHIIILCDYWHSVPHLSLTLYEKILFHPIATYRACRKDPRSCDCISSYNVSDEWDTKWACLTGNLRGIGYAFNWIHRPVNFRGLLLNQSLLKLNWVPMTVDHFIAKLKRKRVTFCRTM